MGCPTKIRNVVHYLVYDGVPVEGLVLLHVARVARGTPQVLEGDAGPHGAGGDRAIEPVYMVTQTFSSLREHQGVRPHRTGGQEVHLEAGGVDQKWEGGDQDQRDLHNFNSCRSDKIWRNTLQKTVLLHLVNTKYGN